MDQNSTFLRIIKFLSIVAAVVSVFFLFYMVIVLRSAPLLASIILAAILGYVIYKIELPFLQSRLILRPILQIMFITGAYVLLPVIVLGLYSMGFLSMYDINSHKDSSVAALIIVVFITILAQQISVWVYLLKYKKTKLISWKWFLLLIPLSMLFLWVVPLVLMVPFSLLMNVFDR